MFVSTQNSPIPGPSTFNKNSPWRVSAEVFRRTGIDTNGSVAHRKIELLPQDPEYQFVLNYFNQSRPTNRAIKHVFCILNNNLTSVFEHALLNMDNEAKNAFFKPAWLQNPSDPLYAKRQSIMKRFFDTASHFNPCQISQTILNNVFVLPVWHGTNKKKCESICETGFTFFGKQSEDTNSSTDAGYYGSGIYFANSADYASLYSDGEHLLVAFVSMRSPYPVTTDKPLPQEGSDMGKLKRQGAFQILMPITFL